MKRIVIAISLFIVILASCITETIFLNNIVNNFIEIVETTIDKVEDEDIDSAIENSEKAAIDWESNELLLANFIDHSRLQNINEYFISMKIDLLNDKKEDFFLDSAIIISQLNHLRNTEFPLIENIF